MTATGWTLSAQLSSPRSWRRSGSAAKIAARCKEYNGWYASWLEKPGSFYEGLIGDLEITYVESAPGDDLPPPPSLMPTAPDDEQRPQCLDPSDIDDFIDFVKASGGFSIW